MVEKACQNLGVGILIGSLGFARSVAIAQQNLDLMDQRRQCVFSERVAIHPPCITGVDYLTFRTAVEQFVQQTKNDIREFTMLVYDDGNKKHVLFSHKNANPNSEGSDPKAPSFECEVDETGTVLPCRPSM